MPGQMLHCIREQSLDATGSDIQIVCQPAEIEGLSSALQGTKSTCKGDTGKLMQASVFEESLLLGKQIWDDALT